MYIKLTRGLLLLALTVQCTLGHLCLLRPSQRGDLDISEAGSHTCFRHGPPCGGEPAKAPTFTLRAGETFFFKWQQNFNHYEVGFPGYMDLSVALINSTEFSFLAGFGDVNWHQQSHQQNYTVPAVVPDIDCKWCVLRARYVPHKPGETTFYQCADIAITTSPVAELEEGNSVPYRELTDRLNATVQFLSEHRRHSERRSTVVATTRNSTSSDVTAGVYGMACNPLDSPMACQFVRVTIDGTVEKMGRLDYTVDAEGPLPATLAPNDFIYDQISAYDGERLYYLVHVGDLDEQTDSLMSIDPSSGKTSVAAPLHTGSHAINALDYDRKSKQFIALQIIEDVENAGNYYFRISRIDLQENQLMTIYQTEKTEDLYVNYQWSTIDTNKGIFYYLMGNENDPYGLTARLYGVNISAGTGLEPVTVAASYYTLGSIQYDAKYDRLVALSPGLFKSTAPAWSVVRINSQTGAVGYLCKVAPAGIFQIDYSGAIFNINPESGVMYSRLRVANEPADIMVTVVLEEDTCTTFYSQLGNFYHIHNMANVY